MKALRPESNGAGGGREARLDRRDLTDPLNHLESTFAPIDPNDLVERAQLVCKACRNRLGCVIATRDQRGAACVAQTFYRWWAALNMEGTAAR